MKENIKFAIRIGYAPIIGVMYMYLAAFILDALPARQWYNVPTYLTMMIIEILMIMWICDHVENLLDEKERK